MAAWLSPLAWIMKPPRYSYRKHRRVRIGNRVFPSASSAAQVLGYSESYVRCLIYRKKASYVYDES